MMGGGETLLLDESILRQCRQRPATEGCTVPIKPCTGRGRIKRKPRLSRDITRWAGGRIVLPKFKTTMICLIGEEQEDEEDVGEVKRRYQ
jgi:hypothetical protein